MAEAPSTPFPSTPDPEATLASIRAASQAQAEPAKADDDNPLAQERYAFSITYLDKTGVFENKILTLQDRIDVGLLQARLAQNTPWQALDEDTRYLVQVTAHLAGSLTKKPAWFSLANLLDPAVAFLVYEEVARHEAYFRGRRPPQKAGATAA